MAAESLSFSCCLRSFSRSFTFTSSSLASRLAGSSATRRTRSTLASSSRPSVSSWAAAKLLLYNALVLSFSRRRTFPACSIAVVQLLILMHACAELSRSAWYATVPRFCKSSPSSEESFSSKGSVSSIPSAYLAAAPAKSPALSSVFPASFAASACTTRSSLEGPLSFLSSHSAGAAPSAGASASEALGGASPSASALVSWPAANMSASSLPAMRKAQFA
mmetsp:Transcript_74716/g.175302  ORF Transcript_74716/g.175302 Transcript_74716/m.175302 type:complete len:220 (+) Transcript_74716:1108-1767(+)